MSTEKQVADHYTHGGLIAAIVAGLEKLGKTPQTVTIDDLAAVDEFHIGGRQASEDFLSRLGLTAASHVLDVGSGLGGPSRFTASRFGARVAGIDLTPEYVETGRELNRWLGLDARIDLQQASALAMPFADASFDAAYMMHVGMNIADKKALAAEVARVLKAGGPFGIYDVMRVGEGDLAFPVPWAASPETSALATPAAYRQALEAAGFRVTHERNRRAFALDFFEQMAARTAAEGPAPLGIHVLMGETRAEKVKNMLANVKDGIIAPVEMIGVLG
jgi:ubiquinone/menaquinone biosynthesis C-methylase UbiE